MHPLHPHPHLNTHTAATATNAAADPALLSANARTYCDAGRDSMVETGSHTTVHCSHVASIRRRLFSKVLIGICKTTRRSNKQPRSLCHTTASRCLNCSTCSLLPPRGLEFSVSSPETMASEATAPATDGSKVEETKGPVLAGTKTAADTEATRLVRVSHACTWSVSSHVS